MESFIIHYGSLRGGNCLDHETGKDAFEAIGKFKARRPELKNFTIRRSITGWHNSNCGGGLLCNCSGQGRH